MKTIKSAPLTREALVSFFAESCKSPKNCQIGIEYETFPFNKENYRPLSYDGKKGLQILLEKIQKKWGWMPLTDTGKIIGLVDPKSGCKISLEPGGQFEFSGSPHVTIHEIEKETLLFLENLKEITHPLKIGFLRLGGNPMWRVDDMPRMPKSRYALMENIMPTVGNHGLDMMFRTCTIHVSLDFSSEEDMRLKMQTGLKLQPLVNALFANSPFTEKKLNGFESWRYFIWQHTDSKRCDIPQSFFSSSFGFEDYIEWALDIPMYFIIRNNVYYDIFPITFREFMQKKSHDRALGEEPTLEDWKNHLSTLFPEVRLKSFLEMRGADSGSQEDIFALSAFWAGLLYSKTALDSVQNLTKDWTFEEVQILRKDVPQKGLCTEFRHHTLNELAQEFLSIAHLGLKERYRSLSNTQDETFFLNPLYERAESGISKSKKMLTLWKEQWKNSMGSVFQENSF